MYSLTDLLTIFAYSIVPEMKRQKTKLNPVHWALISIDGKWFAEKQLATPH